LIFGFYSKKGILPAGYGDIDDAGAYAIQSYCISPDGFVFVSVAMGDVIQFDMQGNIVKSHQVPVALYNLVMLGDTLYGYAYHVPEEDETDHSHEAHEAQSAIFALHTKTGAVKQLPLEYKAMQVRAMAGYAGELLLLCVPYAERVDSTTDEATGRKFMSEQLVKYNIADGSHTILDTDAVTALTSLGDGRVLLYGFDGKSYLAEMNIQSAAIGSKTYLDYLGNLYAITKNSVSGDLFFSSSDQVGLTGVFADMPSRLASIPGTAAPLTGNDLQYRDGYLLALDSVSGILHRNKVMPPAKEAVTLQIDKSFSRSHLTRRAIGLDSWISEYRIQTGNNISTRSHFSASEQFIAALSSGSDKTDAYIISLSEAYAYGIFDQAAYHPLAGDIFDTFYGKTFDWVSDAMTDGNGEYWALPMFLDSYKIYYSPSKLAAYGLDVSIFDTYEAMLEAAEMLKEKRNNGLCNAGITGFLYLAFNQVNQYFIAKGLENTTFDTPEFRAAMDIVRVFMDPSHTDAYNDYAFTIVPPFQPTLQDIVFMTEDDSALQYYAYSRHSYELSDELAAYESMLVLPYPKLNADASMPTIMEMDVLIINPNSKNKEEVLRFAECAAKAMLAPVRADASAPLVPILFKDKTVYQNIYNANSAQFESLYNYYSEGAVQNIPKDVVMYLYDYAWDRATMDDAIFAVERYMEMRLRERQ